MQNPKPFVFPVMKKAIESLFTKPHITKEDIELFQDRYWEQLVPNFSQALKLLDIHGVSRHSILWALVSQVLGKTNSIKERHVNLIVDNPYLYDDAPLPVLRHIWVAHPHKFQEELHKVITRFQSNWSDALLDTLSMAVCSTASSTADLVPLLYWPPRRRRRDAAIVRIVEMIGDDQVLYEKIVNILREECMRAEQTAHQQASTALASVTAKEPNTPPPPPKRRRRLDSTSSNNSNRDKVTNESSPALISATLCTLRFDILMSLNEAKVDRLCVPDRIHRLVWGLDACVRNRRIDPRHASGLAYHLTIQRQRAKRASEDAAQSLEDQTEEEEEEEDGRADVRRSSQLAS
ncbi:unnamed protein product, partial [Echinostoma caproni]|uniref:Uncharacterized protein n=1 Tax=Echinostoma caproni TaxID=27848 RepID=A0A183B522_9TREM